MKKIFSVLLVLAILLSALQLSGCKDDIDEPEGTSELGEGTTWGTTTDGIVFESIYEIETYDITIDGYTGANIIESPQLESYRMFEKAVNCNVYDKWLNDVLEEGKMPLSDIYAKYSAFWINEMNFTIEMASKLFDNTSDYESWKNEICKWLEITTNIIRTESSQLIGQLPRIEITIQKCELIRQKVIDTKYFCYILEQNISCDISTNMIGLKWDNNLNI